MHRETYLRYLESPEWAKKRDEYWGGRKRRCQRCGRTENLHVHHMSYVYLGDEPLGDLIGLCKGCHWLVHTTHQKEGGSLRDVTLRVVADKPPSRIPPRPKVPRQRAKPIDKTPRCACGRSDDLRQIEKRFYCPAHGRATEALIRRSEQFVPRHLRGYQHPVMGRKKKRKSR